MPFPKIKRIDRGKKEKPLFYSNIQFSSDKNNLWRDGTLRLLDDGCLLLNNGEKEKGIYLFIYK